jgi:hypothetical protein
MVARDQVSGGGVRGLETIVSAEGVTTTHTVDARFDGTEYTIT